MIELKLTKQPINNWMGLILFLLIALIPPQANAAVVENQPVNADTDFAQKSTETLPNLPNTQTNNQLIGTKFKSSAVTTKNTNKINKNKHTNKATGKKPTLTLNTKESCDFFRRNILVMTTELPENKQLHIEIWGELYRAFKEGKSLEAYRGLSSLPTKSEEKKGNSQNKNQLTSEKTKRQNKLDHNELETRWIFTHDSAENQISPLYENGSAQICTLQQACTKSNVTLTLLGKKQDKGMIQIDDIDYQFIFNRDPRISTCL